jgi:FkbH-like protein
MGADSNQELYTISVKDRYGDSGITGLGILRFEGDTAHIDVFLMSCRVLGRKIENALLAFLADRSRERNAQALNGYFYPSEKNAQVADFYENQGFTDSGNGIFQLNLIKADLKYPSAVRVEIEGSK